jgi:tRNA (cytidine32/uridine32-2'-O)-methyltransferase
VIWAFLLMSGLEVGVSGFEESDQINRLAAYVSVVLVKTTHSGNIGAVARAMKNMGFADLRLVLPKEFPSPEAEARSSGASDVLENAKLYNSLDDALSDSIFTIGASARSRSFPWPLFHPRDCAAKILGLINERSASIVDSDGAGSTPKIALVFGQEASGLTNDELQRCNYHVCIPANPNYSSLNLAMAVQVICYELRMSSLACYEQETGVSTGLNGPGSNGWDADSATHEEVNGVVQHFEDVVIKTGFLDPKAPGLLIPRLRRLLQRVELDKMEVNILRGMLTSIQKKL